MHFDEKLIEILKNFSTINPSIVFKPGKTVSTISAMKAIFGTAKTDVEFPREFAVYDLGQLLSVLSLCDKPEIECKDTHLLIKDGSESFEFVYCSPSLVATPPAGQISLDPIDVEFKLTDVLLTRALKVAATLSSREIALVGDGEHVRLSSFDSKKSDSHTWKATVGETSKTFKLVFLLENLKLLPRDYEVTASRKGFAKFVAEDIEYFVAVEAKASSFGN